MCFFRSVFFFCKFSAENANKHTENRKSDDDTVSEKCFEFK